MLTNAIPPDSHLSHIKHSGIDFIYNLLIDRIVIKGVINIATNNHKQVVVNIPINTIMVVDTINCVTNIATNFHKQVVVKIPIKVVSYTTKIVRNSTTKVVLDYSVLEDNKVIAYFKKINYLIYYYQGYINHIFNLIKNKII